MKRLLALLLIFGVALAQPAAQPITFNELYNVSIRGMEFSSKTIQLNGKRVEMKGYMAPPLRPRLDFFVLTKVPLATCPFCSSAADWAADIVLVYLPKGKEVIASPYPVRIRGRLEMGVKEDPETGFVSLLRIYADEYSEIR
jgi:hypothetical protein